MSELVAEEVLMGAEAPGPLGEHAAESARSGCCRSNW
jgi:hypothetical protein